MMKRWKILMLFMFLVLVETVTATTIQISTDNTTWVDVTSSAYAGSICENSNVARVENLQEGTIYYLRGQNETHDWEYTKFRTKGGNRMISIIVGLIASMAAFGIIGFFSKGLGLKVFGYGIAYIELVAIMFLLYLNELGLDMAPFLRINFWVVFILVFGMGMIGLTFLVMRLVNVADPGDEEIKWGNKKR